jgi:hypothetical protein
MSGNNGVLGKRLELRLILKTALNEGLAISSPTGEP